MQGQVVVGIIKKRCKLVKKQNQCAWNLVVVVDVKVGTRQELDCALPVLTLTRNALLLGHEEDRNNRETKMKGDTLLGSSLCVQCQKALAKCEANNTRVSIVPIEKGDEWHQVNLTSHSIICFHVQCRNVHYFSNTRLNTHSLATLDSSTTLYLVSLYYYVMHCKNTCTLSLHSNPDSSLISKPPPHLPALFLHC